PMIGACAMPLPMPARWSNARCFCRKKLLPANWPHSGTHRTPQFRNETDSPSPKPTNAPTSQWLGSNSGMNPQQRELFRLALLRVLDANQTRYGLGLTALAH